MTGPYNTEVADEIEARTKRVNTDRILVIAQNVSDIRNLCEAISDYVPGTAVLWCWDVTSALSLVQDLATPPDLMLLHREASATDNARLVQGLKSLPSLQQVPLIVITSGEEPGSVAEPGIDMCFVKPFEVSEWNELGKVIRRVVRRKSTGQPALRCDSPVFSE